VLLPLLIALGNWQLHRADEKASLQAEWAARSALPPLQVGPPDLPNRRPAELAGRRVALQGDWDTERQVLLDNQVSDGKAGYLVFTPLRIGGGRRAVLVNRGWLPADPRREIPPDVRLVPGHAMVSGVAAPPPASGYRVGSDIDTDLGPGLLRVQKVDMNELSRRLGFSLEPWTLWLDPAAPDGYRRRWQAQGLQPERHRAYAVQWFLLATVLAGLYLGLNLRRTPG
jgi:surfeit locus 1 family protein